MKIRNTLFLLLLVALAVVYVVAVDSEKLSTKEKLERATRLVTFRPQNVGAIEITNAGELVRLARKDGRWQLESPAEDVADPVAVHELLEALNDLQIVRPVDLGAVGNPGEKLQDFGLKEPRQQVLLKGDGEPVLLEFGVEDSQGEWVYARSSRDDRIAQISTEIKEQLFAQPDSFRDPVLTRVPPEQIQGLRVRTAEGEMLLVLEDGFWRFEKPLQARADNQAVFEALQTLGQAEIQEVAGDGRKDLAPYGLAPPRGSIQLFLAPDAEPFTTIEIGSRVQPQEDSTRAGQNGSAETTGSAAETDQAQEPAELVYVTQQERDAVFTMPAEVAKLLDTPPNALRDRSLLGFPAEVVNRILLRTPEQEEPVILELQPAGWFVKIGPEEMTPAHQASVQSLLKTLAQAEVREFMSEVTTGADRYGLDEPAYELELETSAERLALLRRQLAQQARQQGALPEGAQLGGLITEERLPHEVQLAFAKPPEAEDSGALNALLRQKGNIVQISDDVVDNLYPRPFQWRSLILFNLRPDRLQKMVFSGRNALDDGEITFERGDDGIWQVTQGDLTVDPRYVDAAAGALAQLRALDWVAPRLEPGETYGFDPPTLKVSFTISGEEEPRELVLGQLVPQRGGYFATIAGLEPIFLLSLPDYEVLTAPLELAEKRAAAPGND